LFDHALYNVLGNKGFTHTHLPPPISHFKFLPDRKKRMREKTLGWGKRERNSKRSYFTKEIGKTKERAREEVNGEKGEKTWTK
jgi:hypothetical protein